jgi:hypothetical protein
MDTFGADTGVGGLTTLLESSIEALASENEIWREGERRSVYAYLFLR